MLGDFTDKELAELAASGAPQWARTAVKLRERLLDEASGREQSGGLLAEIEDFSRTLRPTAVGATPEVIAKIGRVRGVMSAYALKLRQDMMRR